MAIDSDSRSIAADMTLAGDFRFAQSDDDGHVFVSVGKVDRYDVNRKTIHAALPPRIARFDALAIAAAGKKGSLELDWSKGENENQSLVRFLPQRFECGDPQGLAIDGRHQRLFVECGDQKLDVLDAGTGNGIASVTIGPGGNVLAYDPANNLIFSANGDGYGSLTIVRQDANTDSYAVIQNLPTRERARTVAADPSTGNVYLVTDYRGVDLTKQGGIGTLRTDPVPGSFQVLAIGR